MCSNRTIVGLKQTSPRPCLYCNNPQQSHHCGIETVTVQVGEVVAQSSNRTIVGLKLDRLRLNNQLALNAAIAPLWD